MNESLFEIVYRNKDVELLNMECEYWVLCISRALMWINTVFLSLKDINAFELFGRIISPLVEVSMDEYNIVQNKTSGA